MKRSPLKRGKALASRRRRAPLYDQDREAMLEWRRGRHVCHLCTRSQANGVLVDCHHVIPQRVIRRWVETRIHEGRDPVDDRPLLLRRLLWDRRNRMPLCRPHHDAVETRALVLTRDRVPGETWEFARELGLEWWLERFTDEETAA